MSERKPTQNLNPEAARKLEELKRKQQELAYYARETQNRLAYLDELAQGFTSQLNQFKSMPPTPELQAKIARMERKLNSYRAVRTACSVLDQGVPEIHPEKAMTAEGPIVSPRDNISFLIAEAEITITNAKLFVDELAPKMKLFQTVVGRPGPIDPQMAQVVNTLKMRVKANPDLGQRMAMTLQHYQDAIKLVAQGEQNLAVLKQKKGKEAREFLAQMKYQQISGKLYYLEKIEQIFANEPAILGLFPAPDPVIFPKVQPGASGAKRTPTKPLTGRLLDALGINSENKPNP